MRVVLACAFSAALVLSGCLDILGSGNKAPAVDVGGPYAAHVNQPFTFTASVADPDGKIALCEWDFDGDGTYDWSLRSAATAQHAYAQAGGYVARLRVTDDDGKATVAECTVVVAPDIASGGGPYTVTVGEDLVFGASVGSSFGFTGTSEWDFDGDGVWDWSSETSSSARHTYQSVGTYEARLRRTDADGNTQTQATSIRVVVDIATAQFVREHQGLYPRCVTIAGDWIAYGSYHHVVGVMDLATGDQVRTFTGHQYEVYSVAVSGNYVVSGSRDQTAWVWDIATGRPVEASEDSHGPVVHVAALDTRVATVSDGDVWVWGLRTGILDRVIRGNATSMSVSGCSFMWGSEDGAIRTWNPWVGGGTHRSVPAFVSDVPNQVLGEHVRRQQAQWPYLRGGSLLRIGLVGRYERGLD